MYLSASTHVVNDQLNLKEGQRYYSLVNITNALGYSYILRSNGVTISSNLLIPGEVYDGLVTGYDLTVVPSRTIVSTNWDNFGKSREDVLNKIDTGRLMKYLCYRPFCT